MSDSPNDLPRTPADARHRGLVWADAWNRRDVDAVLDHFDEQVTFRSPMAVDVVGRGTLQGKSALRDYWMRALARVPVLHFTVDRVLWDAEQRELAVVYTAALGDKRRRACERMTLNDRGMVVEAEALYGTPLDA